MSSKPEPSRGEMLHNFNTERVMDLVTSDLFHENKENNPNSNVKEGRKENFLRSSDFKVGKFLIGK